MFLLLYRTGVGTGVPLRSPALTPLVGFSGGAVLSVPVGFCTLLGPTVLFQLTFTFIYNTFSKKFSVLAK